ncbi:uncharacterized protein [Arachis hypogaea]
MVQSLAKWDLVSSWLQHLMHVGFPAIPFLEWFFFVGRDLWSRRHRKLRTPGRTFVFHTSFQIHSQMGGYLGCCDRGLAKIFSNIMTIGSDDIVRTKEELCLLSCYFGVAHDQGRRLSR